MVLFASPSPSPQAPPRCYVRPTKEMDIKVGHRHVDRDGLIYLPYLHEWNARSHNVTELCAAMSSVFGLDPPVYAVRRGGGGGGGSVSPAPASFSTSLYPGQMGSLGRQPTSQQPQPPLQARPSPPPAYESVTGPGGGAYGNGGGMESGASSPANQQAQAEAKRREAAQQVLDKTHRALKGLYGRVSRELEEEEEKQVALQTHRKEVLASIGGLKKKKEEAEERIRKVMEMDGRLDAWIKEQEGRPPVGVDDMIEAADPPSRQMLELVAQNAAIEDALYHLDKALTRGNIDHLVFLKKVRELAREQFMCVAHVNKIYRAQQAALAASRAPPSQTGQFGGARYLSSGSTSPR